MWLTCELHEVRDKHDNLSDGSVMGQSMQKTGC